MKPKFDVEALLNSFCDVQASAPFCTPYQTHGYMCATNGFRLIMIRDDGKHDYPEGDRWWKPIPVMKKPYSLDSKDIRAALIADEYC